MKYCPKCGCEHQDWVELCSECKTELVDELPTDIKTRIGKETTFNSSDKLVPIATFDYPEAAHLASSKLDSEGIWSFLADEHMVTANRFYSFVIGGSRLMVKESDAAEAIRILEMAEPPKIVEPPPEETLPEDICPRCHSANIRCESNHTLPFMKRKFECNSCDYQWKK